MLGPEKDPQQKIEYLFRWENNYRAIRDYMALNDIREIHFQGNPIMGTFYKLEQYEGLAGYIESLPVHTIEFKELHINSPLAKGIAQAFSKTQVLSFKLNYNHITWEGVIDVIRVLANSCVVSLDFTGNNLSELTDELAEQLKYAIKMMPKLVKLNLSSNNLTWRDGINILKALEGSSVKFIDFSSTYLPKPTPEELMLIIPAIKRTNLLMMNLDYCLLDGPFVELQHVRFSEDNRVSLQDLMINEQGESREYPHRNNTQTIARRLYISRSEHPDPQHSALEYQLNQFSSSSHLITNELSTSESNTQLTLFMPTQPTTKKTAQSTERIPDSLFNYPDHWEECYINQSLFSDQSVLQDNFAGYLPRYSSISEEQVPQGPMPATDGALIELNEKDAAKRHGASSNRLV